MTTSTRHALLVGGSAGIGLGVALSVAPLVTKLTICSRSCPPDLIAIIKARNPDADVVFERLDLSLMHEVRKFTTKHAATNFDWIVLTAGFLHLNGRTETVEGLDDMMGAVYYGRFPWYIRLPVNAMSALFATTIETCGERMTLALTKDEFATGWKLLNERAEEVPKTKFHTDELKDLVWDHTIQTIDDALKK
ncbi:hypothetical protein BBJ28_00005189 [Nothophytophthora sp. Chile5]|nr:hypothetical protein BBJ28_00005189 [Nothophytophthora sp. Chile5]